MTTIRVETDRRGLIISIAAVGAFLLFGVLFLLGMSHAENARLVYERNDLAREIEANSAEISTLTDRMIYLQEMFSFEGKASWYGTGGEHGRIGANNKRFDMFARTMATKFLPFHKMKWRVTRLDTGKSIIVESTDDGPNVKGRLFDFSYQAAVDLGMIKAGTASVRITPEF
jgi:rare lipoprotein A